jgi:uncharacterized DUF497 family protein
MIKIFKWDKEKNTKLIKERGISFEMISKAIEDGHLLDIIDNPSRSNQRLFIVKLGDYAILVPFVLAEDHVFLKTAYPSRKYTKKYLR